MSNIFDELAAQRNANAQPVNAPPANAQPANAPSSPSQGNIFDQLAAGNSQVSFIQGTGTSVPPQQPQQLTDDPNDISIRDADGSLSYNPLRYLGAGLEGVGEGVLGTAANLSDIRNKAFGDQPGQVNQWLHKMAGDQNSHNAAAMTGQVAEGIGEFLMGSEALKSIPIADRFTAVGKLMKVVEAHPILGSALENALLGGVQGGVKSESWKGAGIGAAVGGATGAAVTGATEMLGDSPQVLSRKAWEVSQYGHELPDNPFQKKAGLLAQKSGVRDPGSLITPSDDELIHVQQNDIKQYLREAVQDAANRAGVPLDPPGVGSLDYLLTHGSPGDESALDIINNAARAFKNSATEDYAVIDQATNQRWTNTMNKIRNLETWLKENAGIADDEKFYETEAKRDDLLEAQDKMIAQLKADKMVEPAIADRASARFKAGSALEDVQNDVRAAFSRKRISIPDVNRGDRVEVPTVIDHVNPDTLATRLAKRALPNTKGINRLDQAFPEGVATTLRNNITEAQLTPARIREAMPIEKSGREAMLKLIEDNSHIDPVLGFKKFKTDWLTATKQFEKLVAERGTINPSTGTAIRSKAIFNPVDEAAARKFLYSRLRYQNIARTTAKTAGVSGVGTGVGYLTYRVLKHLIGE